MRRLVSILFLVSLLVGCQFRSMRPASTLVLRLEAMPYSYDPHAAKEFTAKQIASYVFESLLERNRDTFEFEGALAESYEQIGNEIKFNLRRGVRWHDGTFLDSNDVVASFLRAKKSGAYGAYLSDLEDAKALGEHAVLIKFKKPYFRSLDICATLPIVKADDPDPKTGTGPYKFFSGQISGRVTLVRNDDYWGGRPAIERIEFALMPDSSSALQELKKNSIDALEMNALQAAKQTDDEKFKSSFEKISYHPPNYTFIAWNMNKPFFSDRRVRQAMTMLTDREEILKNVLFGQGEIVTSGFYLYGPDYDRAIEPYPYDPAHAVRLLDEAGWVDHDGDKIRDKDGVKFSFGYYYPAGARVARAVGAFLQEELEKIGVEMSLEQLEWGSLVSLIGARKYDAVSLGMATALDDDPYLVWHCSQAKGGFNLSGFCSGEADLLLEQARSTLEKSKRAELYKKLQRMLNDEQPFTFLFSVEKVAAVSKKLAFKIHRLGLDPKEWAFIEKTRIGEF